MNRKLWYPQPGCGTYTRCKVVNSYFLKIVLVANVFVEVEAVIMHTYSLLGGYCMRGSGVPCCSVYVVASIWHARA